MEHQLMSKHQKKSLPAQVKQEGIITPANKRYMIFFTATLVMLSVAIIISSFTI